MIVTLSIVFATALFKEREIVLPMNALVDVERLAKWRLVDSPALRQFVRIGLTEQTPDHSTISRTRASSWNWRAARQALTAAARDR